MHEQEQLTHLLQKIDRLTSPADMARRLALCHQALELVSREVDPEKWAILQNEIGYSLSRNPKRDQTANIEQAINHFEQALAVFDHHKNPKAWAMVQNNLANAYAQRIQGDRAENLEKAIEHHHHALNGYYLEDDPLEWAETHNNLANTYMLRIKGKRAENIEKAIHLYNVALDVYEREHYPQDWAMIQNNLANAYGERIRGDHGENLEQALAYAKRALQVYDRDAFALDWAMAHLNMANAYFDRVYGDEDENLEKATHHYKLAQEVKTQQTSPLDWALIHNNLAGAYWQRAEGDRAKHIEKAIEHLNAALEVYTQQDFPIDWAMVQNNLGNAFVDRLKGEKKKNIERAIDHFQKALDVYSRQEAPTDWALVQHNLGAAYAEKVAGKRIGTAKQVFSHEERALQIYRPITFPLECQGSALTVLEVAFEQQHWEKVIQAYEDIQAAHQHIMQVAILRKGKERELQVLQGVTAKAAYAHIKQKDLPQAIETLENGRARLLAEALDQNRRDLERLPTLGFEDIYADYQQATGNYEDLLDRDPSERKFPEWQTQVEEAQARMHQAAQAIREQVGKQHPQIRYFLDEIPFGEIRAQAKRAPLVYLMTTPAGGGALLVTQNDQAYLPLPDLTDKLLDHWLLQNTVGENGCGYLKAQMREIPIKPVLDVLLIEIGKQICAPLASCLQEIKAEAVLLIPTGKLAILPFHAATYSLDEKTKTLLDDFTVSYAPSARALGHACNRLATWNLDQPSLLAVGNPLPLQVEFHPLPYARTEAETIANLFPGQPQTFYEEGAIKDDVRNHLDQADYLHFACHGLFKPKNPLQSNLLFSHGESLTLQDLFDHDSRLQARLAVLSACQTALIDYEQLPNETIGLPSGFQQAGIPGVIGTLWPVEDLSTALLMVRFYRHYFQMDTDGEDAPVVPAEALRRAQRWLKCAEKEEIEQYVKEYVPGLVDAVHKRLTLENDKNPPFAHPFFWAGFTFHGL
jgi:CHAT domain-containing protein